MFARMHLTPAAWVLILSSQVEGANTLRPPAVPLVTCDPYFSIWSPSDRLMDSDTTHWSGVKQALTSLARIVISARTASLLVSLPGIYCGELLRRRMNTALKRCLRG